MGEFLLFGPSLGFFSNREFREFKEYSDCRLYSCVGANFPKFLNLYLLDSHAIIFRHSEEALADVRV